MILTDLAVNIAAAVLFFGLGLGARLLLSLWRLRGSRRIFAPLLDGKRDIPVVLTDKQGPSAKSPPKVSLTDLLAFSDLRKELNQLGRETEIIQGAKATLAQLSGRSFISLGGPVHNGLTRSALQKVGLALPVSYDETANSFTYAGKSYGSTLNENGLVSIDHGLLFRVEQLDSKSTTPQAALVAFGIHGHGTKQTVAALLSHGELLARMKVARANDFWALMRYDFKDHEPISCEIVAFGTMLRR